MNFRCKLDAQYPVCKVRETLMKLAIGALFCVLFLFAMPDQVMAGSRPPVPAQEEPAGHNSGGAVCTESFPISPYQPFAPAEPQQTPEPSQLAKEPGRIVPVGDQLGDMGHYYSQVAPSLKSTLHIANPWPLSQPFTLTLYTENGSLLRSLRGCQIEAKSSLTLQAEGGQLTYGHPGSTARISVADACTSVVQGRQDDGALAEAELHGIYHAVVDAAQPLDLQVITQFGGSEEAHSAAQAAGVYAAIPAGQIAPTVHLPGIVATRDAQNWWDTEITVQNSSNKAVDLTFQFCDGHGRCFSNNRARLGAHERRNFLASHLLYEDRNGYLETRSGWFSATLLTSAVDGGATPGGVAVLTSFFKQTVDPRRGRPQAEAGSNCLFMADSSGTREEWTGFLPDSDRAFLRLYNPTDGATRVLVQWIGQDDKPLRSFEHNIAARTTLALDGTALQAHLGLAPGAGPLFLRVVANTAIAIFAWDSVEVLSTVNSGAASGRWYLPLYGAPVVPFRWDSENRAAQDGAMEPGATFGLAETNPAQYQDRPEWARQLNWYSYGHSRQWCDQTVSEDRAYSTNIPLWWGLGPCNSSFADDRTCLNTDTRLQRLRNNLPSNCAGRPLFLANEPDLSAQSYMTLHELGRQIYVVRDWPGELYSPVFASHSYERPTYPPEVLNWCQETTAQSGCPQTPGCQLCRQDGIIDGTVDPYDISFARLEAYFGDTDRWARGESWSFANFVEGMLIHVYESAEFSADQLQWRAPYLQQFRDRAVEAGWPIIVKEYGFVVWSNGSGKFPAINESSVATRVDNLRRLLQQNLGNGEAQYLNNPKKLFWFHTQCGRVNPIYNLLCLFDGTESLSSPVGECWREDAVANDDVERECGRPNYLHLPAIAN